MDLFLNENISHDDLKKYLKEFYNYASKKLNIDIPPRLLLKRDKVNAGDLLGKTGGYDPKTEEIYLYISDRHPKDILRSFSHELVHHAQKLAGFDEKIDMSKVAVDPAYASHDEGLREMERDAFERGNMIFRDWTDGKKMERKNIMAEKTKAKIKMAKAKNMTPLKKEEQVDVKMQAEKQAEEDMRHKKTGGYIEEDTSSGGAVEAVEALEENKQEEMQHPYPELLKEKPRLMQDAFNKKEELVYQELIRRFIKK
jgi:hypothetical protein